jgi:hypothetical protein
MGERWENKYSDAQWTDWTMRILAGENIEAELVDAGVLPGPDTPLPRTNATLHVLAAEEGYGTPIRRFTMLCGVTWAARESAGEHKYFMPSETYWHKHVNCAACRKEMEGRQGK